MQKTQFAGHVEQPVAASTPVNLTTSTDLVPVQQAEVVVTPTPIVPPEAIKQGSFTVWTEPTDPMPQQDYTIVITVDLPTGLKAYDKSDLSGEVVGTDGFRHIVGAGKRESFSFTGHGAKYYLYIPGAYKLVQDTITIRSEILNEQQVIKIVF